MNNKKFEISVENFDNIVKIKLINYEPYYKKVLKKIFFDDFPIEIYYSIDDYFYLYYIKSGYIEEANNIFNLDLLDYDLNEIIKRIKNERF